MGGCNRMTNFEKYKEKILELAEHNEDFALTNDIIVSCDDTLCEDCMLHKSGNYCKIARIEWLYEEYIPPKPKLTKRERAFCEAVEKGWLARDKRGYLFLNREKPRKYPESWSRAIVLAYLEPSFYPTFDFITWEDDEPYSVKEMLTWEVKE